MADADVLDAEKVKQLAEIMGDGFGELRAEFEQVSGRLVDRLHDAAATGDTQALLEAAHSLKSSAGSMGGTRLHGLCRTLEHLAKTDRVDDPADHAARIVHERQRLLNALSAYDG